VDGKETGCERWWGVGGGLAVPEGLAMVQGGTGNELTTCATKRMVDQ